MGDGELGKGTNACIAERAGRVPQGREISFREGRFCWKTEHFKIISGVGWEVLKDGEPFGKVAVTWQRGEMPGDGDLLVGAWLFEKLTGLAREAFPERHGGETNDKPKLEKLEDHATVEMVPGSGNEEARRRLFGNQ